MLLQLFEVMTFSLLSRLSQAEIRYLPSYLHSYFMIWIHFSLSLKWINSSILDVMQLYMTCRISIYALHVLSSRFKLLKRTITKYVDDLSGMYFLIRLRRVTHIQSLCCYLYFCSVILEDSLKSKNTISHKNSVLGLLFSERALKYLWLQFLFRLIYIGIFSHLSFGISFSTRQMYPKYCFRC